MLMDQYKVMAGSMVESINRQAVKDAGVTEEQAGKAIAATNPAVLQAVGEGAANEKDFGDRLKSLAS